MSSDKINNKRIAKNAIFLSLRMLLTTGVAFYTSRIVLERLGFNDFGIYNVVGGIVSMFTVLSSSLTTSISRFITFEIGKGNINKTKTIFSTSIFIQIFLIIFVFIIIETGGVWFLNNRMTILPERLYAANWVLQCSLITFGINMLSIPYNAIIIANEKMNIFAYISIIEALLKLAVAFLLYINLFDNLIWYAILLVITSLVIRLIYGIYCKFHYPEAKFEIKFDKLIFKDMLSFSGWNFMGSLADVLKDQGVNIVLNIFGGSTINAARGIGMQAYHGVRTFSQNFMYAVNPQIIKSYSNGNIEYMIDLSYRSSRLSFCLLYCISLPLLFYTKFIVSLWLGTYPNYTVIFTQLLLIYGLSEVLSMSLQYMIQATGNIKRFQIVISSIQVLNLPFSYLLLKFNFNPSSVFILSIVISQICLWIRLILIKKVVIISINKYIFSVYIKILLTSISGTLIPFFYLSIVNISGIEFTLIGFLITFISAITSSYLFGLNHSERKFFISYLKKIKLS